MKKLLVLLTLSSPVANAFHHRVVEIPDAIEKYSVEGVHPDYVDAFQVHFYAECAIDIYDAVSAMQDIEATWWAMKIPKFVLGKERSKTELETILASEAIFVNELGKIRLILDSNLDHYTLTFVSLIEFQTRKMEQIWFGAKHAHRYLAPRLLGRIARAIANC